MPVTLTSLLTLAASLGGVVAASTLLTPDLRRRFLSRPLKDLFRRALPPISATEKEALEAGTVWWDREIFGGIPDWQSLMQRPMPPLSPQEQAFLDGPVETLCRMLDDWKINAVDHDLPPQVWSFIKENRFFGMVIPREYGGLGFSAMAHSAVVLKVSSRSVTAAVTIMVPNSLGPAELIRHYGTTEQKNHYLPRLAAGLEIPCFALTGPEAGSDASSIPDRGVVCRGRYQGREVLGMRLNWNKRYITLGPVATVLGLAFRLEDPDHLLGEESDRGITLALVPVGTPGMVIGARHDPMGVPFQNGPTEGREVFLPLEMIIGGPQQAGNGWRMLMDCLAEGRSISLPALSTGGAKLAVRVAGAYARVRRQFKLPVGRFEGVAEVLGRMAGQVYLMEAARRLTASAVDGGEKPSVISALTKYQQTERMRRVINDAMDILGGAGICRGPRNLLAPVYQSIPVGITVEGANILTRTLIVFGQGAIRAHPFLLKELAALDHADPRQGLIDFDKAFWSHVRFALGNGLRTAWHGLTGGRLQAVPFDGWQAQLVRKLNRLTTLFALVADLALLVLGGSLKRREALSGRLADMLSDLYFASAVLKQYHDRGQLEEERPLAEWSLTHLTHHAQESLTGFLDNFPLPYMGRLLKRLALPWGAFCQPPSDKLTLQLAELVMTPGALRNRLTEGIFLPTFAGEALADLEEALQATLNAEPVERKLRHLQETLGLPGPLSLEKALQANLIAETEAAAIKRAEVLRRRVIQVDAFATAHLMREEAA
ncbi:MAG: acyl-CoA dehydrogenase [Magnetococcales bacterium]|nr:acyl-CoA dehydrogenase [Magnetococcales bacterium]